MQGSLWRVGLLVLAVSLLICGDKVLGEPDEVDHCTAIGIGRKATASGATMIAHTDDSGPGTSDLRMVYIPAGTHAPGSMRPVHYYEGYFPRIVDATRSPAYAPTTHLPPSKPLGEIPQVEKTYGYWELNYGLVNEAGLGLAESTCGSKTIGFSPMHKGPNLLSIDELTRLALERCATARCAIQTMGNLSVQHGFFATEMSPTDYSLAGAGECLLVSDADDVWHFHVIAGIDGTSAIWAAQRIPEDHVTVLPNSLVIRTMNLSDTENYLASEGVVEAAVAAGFYSPASGRPFDFLAAFSFFDTKAMHLGPHCPPDYNLYAGRRTWRVFDKLAPSLHLDPTLGQIASKKTYPVSVKPDAPVTLAAFKEILRDHYEGTPFDMTRGPASGPFGSPSRWSGGPNEAEVQGGWERAISIHRTTWVFVIESRNPVGGDEVASRATAATTSHYRTRPFSSLSSDGLIEAAVDSSEAISSAARWDSSRRLHAIPEAARTRVWFGFDSPHATVMAPFYATQRIVPPSWTWALQCKMSRSSAFWASNLIKNWVDLRYRVMMPDVRKAQAALEASLVQRADEIEGHVAAFLADSSAATSAAPAAGKQLLGPIDPDTLSASLSKERARAMLESFAVAAAEETTQKWWDLADALVARYANGYQCMGDIDHMIEGERIALGYPKEWLMAVGFHDYPSTLPPRSAMDAHHADGTDESTDDDEKKNGDDSATLGKGALARLAMWGNHERAGGVWLGDTLRRALARILRSFADRIAPKAGPVS